MRLFQRFFTTVEGKQNLQKYRAAALKGELENGGLLLKTIVKNL